MKKKNLLFLAAGGALFALTSCSSDETIANNVSVEEANTISFRALNNEMTRAADEHFTAANDQFAVTAFNQGTTTTPYFDNVIYKTDDGSTFTSTSNKYYWPSSKNLDFYAYAPLTTEVNTTGSAAVTRSGYNMFTVTPGTSVPNQPDFVYAVTKDWGKAAVQTGTDATHQISSTVAGVTINFRHAESKVLIQLKNTNPNLTISVGQVSIGNLRGSEQFTWSRSTNGTTTKDNTDDTSGYYLDGSWSAGSTQNTEYTVSMGDDTYDDDSDPGTANVTRNVFAGVSAVDRALTNTPANHEMILIPQALKIGTKYTTGDGTTPSTSIGDPFESAYISVQLKIQNKANDEYIVGSGGAYQKAIWPLSALTWNPGHKYTYTVDLAGGGYYATNQDTDSDLDPILEGAEIKFVTVTVDAWIPETGNVYTGSTPSTPVAP